MAYAHFLDATLPSEFFAMTNTLSPAAQSGEIKCGRLARENLAWPRIVVAGLVHPLFAEEVAQFFYEQYQ